MTSVITGRHLGVLVAQIAERQHVKVDSVQFENRGFAKISIDCGGDAHKADQVANTVAGILAADMGTSPRITIIDEVVECAVGIIPPFS